jgi:serine/threonine-protein kinase
MRDRASLPQPGDVVAGKYLIERMIGSAGLSIVFGARHVITGKRLAIKWLALDDPGDEEEGRPAGDNDEDLSAHAQVIGHFRHPNVLDIHDVGHLDGATYIVMDWLEGESLAHRLQRVRSLPLAEVYRVLAPCMRGMHEAHLAGIVHGELKPANIFICSATKYAAETVKVLDFGVSKLSSTDADLSTALARSDGAATEHLHYLSPEQLRGMPIDRRTDVYAFGVMMYRGLAGRPPYFAESAGELLWQTTSGSEPSLRRVPGIPPAIEAMVAQAMARDPDARFATLLELAEAFESCLRSPHLDAITRAFGASNQRSSPPPLRKRRVSPALPMRLDADHAAAIEEAETGPVQLPNRPPLELRRGRRPYYAFAAAAVVFAAVAYFAPAAEPRTAASVANKAEAPAPGPFEPKPVTAANVDPRGASIALARLVNQTGGVDTATTTSVAAVTAALPLTAASAALEPNEAKPGASKAPAAARALVVAAPKLEPTAPQRAPLVHAAPPTPAARVTATPVVAAPRAPRIEAQPARKRRDVLDMQLQ